MMHVRIKVGGLPPLPTSRPIFPLPCVLCVRPRRPPPPGRLVSVCLTWTMSQQRYLTYSGRTDPGKPAGRNVVASPPRTATPARAAHAPAPTAAAFASPASPLAAFFFSGSKAPPTGTTRGAKKSRGWGRLPKVVARHKNCGQTIGCISGTTVALVGGVIKRLCSSGQRIVHPAGWSCAKPESILLGGEFLNVVARGLAPAQNIAGTLPMPSLGGFVVSLFPPGGYNLA